jgi:hypothetical protein
MDDTQMPMDPYMHNAFWLEDRITVTFQLGTTIPTIPPGGGVPDQNAAQGGQARFISPPTFDKTSAIHALKVNDLNDFLAGNRYPTLDPIDFTDTLRAPGATPPADPEQVGKYLFTSRDGQGRFVPSVICFFKFDSTGMKSSPARSSSEMASMPGNGSADNDHDNDDDDHRKGQIDPVPRLVNFINNNLNSLSNQRHVPIVSASPTWWVGNTGNTWPQGCPVTPPIPVPADVRCSSSSGLWPITLPELPTELERMTGDGVNVLILDTLPRQEDINRAVEGAEDHNLLLLDVANNVEIHHNHLPAQIDEPNPSQPKTGKDVKGRLSGGFRMADHGLFIAGIVRDIAPNAHVECIRVLNDFCVGNSTSFTKALESIHNRMLLVNPEDSNKQGDLYQKPVVLNLSLVIPDDKNVTNQGLQMLDKARQDVLNVIQSLVDLGALIAASAGNEGDDRYQPANPTHVRPNALYPAGFVYNGLVRNEHMLVPVGAVDKHGKPTSYSCYPGDLGIATYGGDVPKHFKKDESGCFTEAEDIDAMVGIYTSLSYPALLLEDCRPTYPIPNAHAWAYWSGTSFATPIISGLAARILQYGLENASTPVPPNVSMSQALTNAGATRQVTWDRLEPDFRSEPGQMILAVQCTSVDEDEREAQEQVEVEVINLTINEYSQ